MLLQRTAITPLTSCLTPGVHFTASEVSIKQTPLQTDWVRLIRPFRGAATGQHLESSPRLPFELPEELARAQWLARLCRTPE
jgi:hypothetical protein